MCLALDGLATISVVDKFGRRRLMSFSTACVVLTQAAVAGLSSDLTTRSHLLLLHGHVHTLPHRYVHNPIHVPHRNRSARYLSIRHTSLPRAARRQAGFFNFMKLPKSKPVAFASIALHGDKNIVFAATSAASWCGVLFVLSGDYRRGGRWKKSMRFSCSPSRFLSRSMRVAKTLPVGWMLDYD